MLRTTITPQELTKISQEVEADDWYSHLPYTVGFNIRRNQSTGSFNGDSSFDVTAPVPNLLKTLGQGILVTPPKTPPAPDANGKFFFESHVNEIIAEESDGEQVSPTPEDSYSRVPSRTATTSPPRTSSSSITNRTTRRTSRRRSSAERSGLLKNASWFIGPYDQGNGGLKNAISAALGDGVLSNTTWVGTLGIPTDNLGEGTRADIDVKLREDYDSLVVYCKDADFEGHYTHYCKEVRLCPVFLVWAID